MSERPLLIEDDDLSRAWVRAFAALNAPGVEALTPLVLTVRLPGDGQVPQVPAVGALVDAALSSRGIPLSGTTANTIFPNFWNPARPRSELFDRYQKMLPKLRRERLNCYGIYFERMIAYGPDGARRNQLEYIISTYTAGNHRRSALQASILDPARDQTNQRRRHFPCLQQVSFLPDPQTGLTITGYYATQYIVDRAFGNYLGLCRLGRFVAHEIGLPLTRMTCVAATAQPGAGWTKAWGRAQLDPLCRALAAAGVPLPADGDAGGSVA
jgi:hypothetical protein